MNSFVIKIIAVTSMVIDHIGLFFFPDLIGFRYIGRLAFPLFAWLLASGAYHSRSVRKYLIRLLILAFIAQVPFILANRLIDPYFLNLNIVFTLALGLAAMSIIKKSKNKYLWFLVTVICAASAELLKIDYGAFGLVSVIGFYIFLKNKKYLILSQIIIFLFPFIFLLQYKFGSFEPLGLISLIFICFYNGKQGPKAKYLFYIFYPLQYVVIYLLKLQFLH